MIRASVTDSQALAAITPEAIRQHAERTGWVRLRCSTERTLYYGRPAVRPRDFRELSVPIGEGYAAYADRIGDAIRLLALVEDRSELDVFVDLGGDLGERRTLPE